uniref:tyrosine--tRNA ligase n=1 Tax=Glossina austeni TaxID=7395 RepID=A0A1A9UK87_GLOAU
MMTNIIQELYDRGLIEKLTDENHLIKIVQEKKIHLYCGFDPTAESLHIGHLIPLLCLKHFYLNGHTPIIVIGGATALIGDPKNLVFIVHFLQAYDYCFLNNKHNVILQIGGSDQWGNITLGIDLVNHINKKSVYGLTTPLLVRPNGSKLGKSDDYKSVVWLDKNKTSVYDFYQFWINSPDHSVFKFLKMFTFLKISDINKLEKKFIHKKIKPFLVQKILAQEITRIVHGDKQLNLVKKATEILFLKEISKISEEDFVLLSTSGISIYKISEKNIDIKSVLVNSGLSKSKKNANDMILCSAISINNKKNISSNYIFNNSDKLYNKYTILKKGKKNFCLLIWKIDFNI